MAGEIFKWASQRLADDDRLREQAIRATFDPAAKGLGADLGRHEKESDVETSTGDTGFFHSGDTYDYAADAGADSTSVFIAGSTTGGDDDDAESGSVDNGLDVKFLSDQELRATATSVEAAVQKEIAKAECNHTLPASRAIVQDMQHNYSQFRSLVRRAKLTVTVDVKTLVVSYSWGGDVPTTAVLPVSIRWDMRSLFISEFTGGTVGIDATVYAGPVVTKPFVMFCGAEASQAGAVVLTGSGHIDGYIGGPCMEDFIIDKLSIQEGDYTTSCPAAGDESVGHVLWPRHIENMAVLLDYAYKYAEDRMDIYRVILHHFGKYYRLPAPLVTKLRKHLATSRARVNITEFIKIDFQTVALAGEDCVSAVASGTFNGIIDVFYFASA